MKLHYLSKYFQKNYKLVFDESRRAKRYAGYIVNNPIKCFQQVINSIFKTKVFG